MLTDTKVSKRFCNKLKSLLTNEGILWPNCPIIVYAIGLWISSPSEINFIIPFNITPATRINGVRLHLEKEIKAYIAYLHKQFKYRN